MTRTIVEHLCDGCGRVMANESNVVRLRPQGYDTTGIGLELPHFSPDVVELSIDSKDFCSCDCLITYFAKEIHEIEAQ